MWPDVTTPTHTSTCMVCLLERSELQGILDKGGLLYGFKVVGTGVSYWKPRLFDGLGVSKGLMLRNQWLVPFCIKLVQRVVINSVTQGIEKI